MSCLLICIEILSRRFRLIYFKKPRGDIAHIAKELRLGEEIKDGWRYYMRWWLEEQPCFQSSAPLPETLVPWRAVSSRIFLPKLMLGFASRKIAIFSIFIGLMVSPSSVWPTIPSAVFFDTLSLLFVFAFFF